jgi:hypothetical protein
MPRKDISSNRSLRSIAAHRSKLRRIWWAEARYSDYQVLVGRIQSKLITGPCRRMFTVLSSFPIHRKLTRCVRTSNSG